MLRILKCKNNFQNIKKLTNLFKIAPSHKAKRHETHVPINHNQFWWGNLRERDNLEDLGVDWRIKLNIRMDLQKEERYSMDCINLAY